LTSTIYSAAPSPSNSSRSNRSPTKKRLEARDPQVRARNLDELRASAADPERARQFLLRTSMIASQRRAEAMALAEK
jgi:hypothetical protein